LEEVVDTTQVVMEETHTQEPLEVVEAVVATAQDMEAQVQEEINIQVKLFKKIKKRNHWRILIKINSLKIYCFKASNLISHGLGPEIKANGNSSTFAFGSTNENLNFCNKVDKNIFCSINEKLFPTQTRAPRENGNQVKFEYLLDSHLSGINSSGFSKTSGDCIRVN
jgi:hypothetical protein